MKIFKLFCFSILSGFSVLFSCQTDSKKKSATDTPVSGTIHIAVDEAFTPIMLSEITAFQGNYPKAKIIPHYVSENRAFELLLKDSVRMVVTSRPFNQEEKDYFKSITISPKSLKIATDAIGVVLHKNNPDTLLTLDQLREILTKPEMKWKSLSGKGGETSPQLVLDKVGTSNYTSLLQILKIKEEEIKIKTVFAGGDREVINYVNQHPESIGFMGVNWISDPEDPTQTRFRNGIKVAHLMSDSIARLKAKDPALFDESYYQPLQAYLAQGFYPLIRDVYVASREARSGLATGFTAWLASDKGQRVILKAGLLPATMPVRIVKIKKDNDLTD
jgi:phosphate transport system substrate-binding protein